MYKSNIFIVFFSIKKSLRREDISVNKNNNNKNPEIVDQYENLIYF